MNDLSDLTVLINDIGGQISDNIGNISENKAYHYIEWHDFLKNIKIKLEHEKYKFVFIGQKGIGKTTTILELFGLSKKLGKKMEDLLTTAAGGTTTCEVELLKSDRANTYFEIEPIDDKLFNQYIDDFCNMYKDDLRNDNENQYLPTEIARSIRNMVGLKRTDIENLYKDCKTFEEFKNEIVRRINSQARTETVINCERKRGTFFEDCQDKFNKINLCKISTVMLPQKIKIFITSDIFDFDQYPVIQSIIDTRGIDTVISSNSDANKMKREDILNYIDKEQEQCIFFFIDSIKPAPSQGISELLRSRIVNSNQFRFYVIINVNGQEAEEVMTDDGKAGTVQVGIDYKKDDIMEKFRQLNISFIESNLLFYNARLNTPAKDDIFLQIQNNLSLQRFDMFKTCEEIKKAFERSRYDFEDNEYALENFEELYKLVENVRTPKDVLNKFLDVFIGELQNIHPARIAAINRYAGNYYAFNFYHEISLIVETLFDEFFASSKNIIINKINEFIKYRNISELDKINYHVFWGKFENDYIEYRNILKEHIKDEVKESFGEHTWEQAVAEYGQGSGYKGRVFEIYKKELILFSERVNLKDGYNSAWNEIITRNNLVKKKSL
ncbi:MAG: hypothetical protein LBT11_07715 [Treponema sp.]|jgi:energy-coupling factor transporter ATP-binding protein EcfA2|nr:hypothetical protein [Treponema sp.]